VGRAKPANLDLPTLTDKHHTTKPKTLRYHPVTLCLYLHKTPLYPKAANRPKYPRIKGLTGEKGEAHTS
jgi:hypothetical protein